MSQRATRRKPPPTNGHDPSARYVNGSAVPHIDVEKVVELKERGGLSKKREEETRDLRAVLADTVLRYTTMLRREQISRGVRPEDAQEIVEEYDPVISMALLAVSDSTPTDLAMRAHSEVAQYIRPKLKSVEQISDESKLLDAQRRNDAASQFLDMIDQMARNRRLAHDQQVREKGVVLDRPDPIPVGSNKK